jgi:hypothetical protein
MTFAESLPKLDAELTPLFNATKVLVARDARQLAANPPADPDALAVALRDLLAILARERRTQTAWGFESADATPGPALDVLDPVIATAPDLATAVEDVKRRLLDPAKHAPAYVPLAADTTRRVVDAAALLREPPAWFPVPTRAEALKQLTEAVRRLADEPQSLEPTQRLRRLALFGRLAAALNTQRGPVASRAQQAFTRLVEAGTPADPRAREPDLRRLETLVRAAELFPRRDELRDEKRLARQFRPAHRVMLELARLSEADLLEVLPEALDAKTPEEAINAPRFIAALAAHARRLDDLGAVVRASDAILAAQGPLPTPNPSVKPDPSAREEYKPVADRLLAFARVAYDLAQRDDPMSREQLDASLQRVRSLAADTAAFVSIPGEDELRALVSGKPPPGWTDVVDPHAAAVLASLNADRDAWLKGWVHPDKHPNDEGARLARLRTLLIVLADAAAVRTMLGDANAPTANHWPGWEMSSGTLKALSAGLTDATQAACKDPSDAVLRRLRETFAPVLLAGRLARTIPASVRPWLDELLAGPAPASALMHDRLDDLARVCRQAFELASLGDAAPARLRAWTNDLARACLDEAPVARLSEPAPTTPSP